MPKNSAEPTSSKAEQPNGLDGRNGESGAAASRGKGSKAVRLASVQNGFEEKRLNADRLKPVLEEEDEPKPFRPTDLMLEIAPTPNNSSGGPVSPLDALEAVKAVMPRAEEVRRVSDARYGKKGAIKELDDDESDFSIRAGKRPADEAVESPDGEGEDRNEESNRQSERPVLPVPGREPPVAAEPAEREAAEEKARRIVVPPQPPKSRRARGAAVAKPKPEKTRKGAHGIEVRKGELTEGYSAAFLEEAGLLPKHSERINVKKPQGGGFSLPNFGFSAVRDYVSTLQAMSFGQVAWMVALATPAVALVILMTVPAFLFYTPEHKGYYHFAKSLQSDSMRWLSMVLSSFSAVIAMAYPILLRKRGMVDFDRDDD